MISKVFSFVFGKYPDRLPFRIPLCKCTPTNMQRKYVYLTILLLSFAIIFLSIGDIQGNGVVYYENIPSIDFVQSLNDNPKDIYAKDYSAPKRGAKQIFFVESSCAVSSAGHDNAAPILHLYPSQACAIESAAKTNPDSIVYLFYSCPLNPLSIGRSSELVKKLFEYPNVYVWHQSMSGLFEDTPLEEFYFSGTMGWSFFPTSHASDVLRLVILWKYGGTYLDLDLIVRRSLNDLPTSFATAEDSASLNSAAMRLSTDALGKKIADMCVEQVRTNFKGYLFAHNGPGLMTRVLQEHCTETDLMRMTTDRCDNFTVLPPPVFYPVHYNDWKNLFDEERSEKTMNQIKYSHGVHLWNSMKKFSFPVTLYPGSKQALVLLEQEFCPVSYGFNKGGIVTLSYGVMVFFMWICVLQGFGGLSFL